MSGPGPQSSSLPKPLPRHVAVIMDGNGRWAQKRGMPRIRGHEEGARSVRAVIRSCRRLGIKVLSLYAFSTENWQRPRSEVRALMNLLWRYLQAERREMHDHHIRLQVSGQIERLSEKVRGRVEEVINETAGYNDMVLNICFSYGGRQEIVQAARALAQEAAAGRLEPQAIDEAAFADRLYTAGLPDPDLLIRTSGEMRLSNFMPWQLTYAELFFSEVLWPDFREPHLLEALEEFARRTRRFGRTEEHAKGGSP